MASNPALQHTINAAVAAAPVASAWARFPEFVTVAVGCAAFIYYVMVIGEKIAGWRAQYLQIKSSSRTVAQRLEEDRRPTTQKKPEDFL